MAARGGIRLRVACLRLATEARMSPAAWLQDFGALHFLRPWWLGTLLLLPLLAWWWRRRQRARSVWQGLVDPHLLSRLLESHGDRRSRVGLWLALLAHVIAVL